MFDKFYNFIRSKIFFVTSLFFCAGNAFAEAPTIQGNVDLTVTAGEIVNVAIGENSVAQVVAGSILTGDIVGDVNLTVTVDSIANAAEAGNACSQVILGSIGVVNCIAAE